VGLPDFDPRRHHIGLGVPAVLDGSALAGFLLAGARRKTYRRDLSDELQGVHYGADSLFNQPGVSSWTMDDFSGGGWQQVWGKDPAMFASCASMLPSQFDRSLRTVPPLTERAVAGAGGGVYSGKPLCTYVASGGGSTWVCVLFPDRIYKFAVGTTGGTETMVVLGDGGLVPYTHAYFDRRIGKLVVAYPPIPGGCGLGVMDPFNGNIVGGSTTEPSELPMSPTGIDGDGDRLVVASGDVIYTAQSGNLDSDIPADWTRIGRLPAPWVASTWMGQQLYILCGSGDGPGSLVAFDGVQVLPICEFPFNFVPASVCAYAGRVYVGGSGVDVAGGASYAELYEVTGSSVRLVKTFAPEFRSDRYAGPTSIRAMCVHEGLLLFGQDGVGLVAYDVTTDSLYGAQTFNKSGSHVGREVHGLVSSHSRVFAWVPQSGAPADNAFWGGVVEGDAAPPLSYSGEVVTSEFGPELDRLKKWEEFRLLTRGDSDVPTVEISTDGGATWTAASLSSTDVSGIGSLRTFDLGSVVSHSVKFRIRLPRTSSPAASFAELVAFSTKFQLVDSAYLHADGTEKLAWSITILGADEVETADGGSYRQDLEAIRDQLWAWALARSELSFEDVDGSVYGVKIDSLSETEPVVLPRPDTSGGPAPSGVGAGREAFYALTLIEV
jgi:hypothetical protein